MDFKLINAGDVSKVKVTFSLPSADKVGVTKNEAITASFKLLPQEEYEAAMDEITAGSLSVRTHLDLVLVAIDDLTDGGTPVPFDVAKPALLNRTRICTALFKAYVQEQLGAKEKNSKR